MKKWIGVLTLVMVPFLVQAQQMQPEKTFFSGGKMVAGAGFNLSGLGTGFGANFEYGITKKFGVMPAINVQISLVKRTSIPLLWPDRPL